MPPIVAHTKTLLQPSVAHFGGFLATLPAMLDWKKWPERYKAFKKQAKVRDADVAEYVNAVLGTNYKRGTINSWLNQREVTLEHFFLICEGAHADPGEILFGIPVLPSTGSLITRPSIVQSMLPTAPNLSAIAEKQRQFKLKKSKLRRVVIKG